MMHLHLHGACRQAEGNCNASCRDCLASRPVESIPRGACLQDISPLENHHVSASFMVAAEDPQADIFEGMRPEDRGTLRASMIDLILGAVNAMAQTHHALVMT